MHELSLLTGVVEAITRAGVGKHVTRVREVALEVGTMSGAIPDALVAAWPLAVSGTIAQDADLKLSEVTAAVWCPHCARDVEIEEFYALTCPECGTPTANLTRGREFTLKYVEWDTE